MTPDLTDGGGGRVDELLVDLAARVADGDAIDWESEAVHNPDRRSEIDWLRWVRDVSGSVRNHAASDRWSDECAQESELPNLVEEAETETEAEPIPMAPLGMWGPLKVLGRIGSGGVGDVFRAYDSQLAREVALKLWRETTTRSTTGTEARRLAKVRHPGILSVHGYGRYDGLAGMWTDLIVGRDLEEILSEEGPFSVPVTCRIGIALCDALGAMHRAKLIHRDVKASNVVLETSGRVFLIDFGSVKELLNGPEDTRHLRGTPLCTAPEVLRGKRVGPAADVYGLGVLLYRMVTGAYPIEATTLGELMDLHRMGRGVPMQQRRRDLPESFVIPVERALHADPAKRPASMAQFRSLLMRVGSNHPSGRLRQALGNILRLARRRPQ